MKTWPTAPLSVGPFKTWHCARMSRGISTTLKPTSSALLAPNIAFACNGPSLIHELNRHIHDDSDPARILPSHPRGAEGHQRHRGGHRGDGTCRDSCDTRPCYGPVLRAMNAATCWGSRPRVPVGQRVCRRCQQVNIFYLPVRGHISHFISSPIYLTHHPRSRSCEPRTSRREQAASPSGES